MTTRTRVLDLFDIGDVIGVARSAVPHAHRRSRRFGSSRLELLAKSLRPLPFGKEEVGRRRDGASLRIRRSGAAVSPAVCGSRRASGGARARFARDRA